MYCLDSDVCIDFLRGKSPDLLRLFKSIDPRTVKVPAITVAELLTGVEKSANPERALQATESFLLAFEVLPFDMNCARTYARIRAQLESKGKPIGRNDLLIAAIALTNQATLITNNTREFKRVNGLRIETWEIVQG